MINLTNSQLTRPMKTVPIWLVSSMLALCLTHCSKPKEESNTNADTLYAAATPAAPVTVATDPSAGNGLQLKGIYVTSTHVPASSYGYKSMFDGDNETYWATMPGAGPDEGVMLYFNEPQTISHFEIKQPAGNNLAKIESVSIYINGGAYKDASLDAQKIELNASEVKSFFIRINKVSKTTSSMNAESGITVFDFPSGSFVGISELTLYRDNAIAHIQVPRLVKATLTASSTLQPEISYGVRNLFDSRKEFVWVEGAKGTGQNEFLTFTFADQQEITGFKIMNGFQRSDKHFTSNGRVKTLIISNENNQTTEVSVGDEQGEQTLQFSNPLTGKKITFTVKEIYPGTTYKDLVISELGLINTDGGYSIEDNLTELIKQELLAKAKNTVLANILDKRIANELSEMDSYKRSIILRSDYTFVAYSDQSTELSSGSESQEIIADGNWEIKELGPDLVKIRIFGKLVRLSESTDYYNGNSSDSYLQIFQDNLTIDAETIRGEKFVQELKLPANDH